MNKSYLSIENFERLDQVIEEKKEEKGALIPVLHEAQEIFGCLSLEVQERISEKMNVPLSEIYGVATFYSQFTLEPKGKYTIGVCMGTACYVRESQAVLDKIVELTGVEVGKTSEDGKFTIEATRCIGACGLAPIITINDKAYGKLVASDIEEILQQY